MSKFPFAAVVVASLALAACGTIDRRDPADLKIATWNIEHLAERDGEGCRPRTEADYAELRRHVEALDADVVAFQEVESRRAAERVFDPALYRVVISERPPTGGSSECRGRPGLTLGHQAVGFAIRNDIPWVRNPDVVDLGIGHPGLRWGVDVTVNAGRPVRLLAIHLKAGCNAGQDLNDPDCPVLFAQAPALEVWIDARARSGEDFVVLGDWNRRISRNGDRFFEIVSDADPIEGQLTVAAGDQGARCRERYREFIDHIATGRTATQRVIPGSFEEYLYGGPEDDHPSDHCPVSIRMAR